MFYLLYVSSHKPNTGIISWNFTILVICHHICWEINQCYDNRKVYGSKISCRWISQNFDEISYFTKLSNMKLPYMTILPMGWIKKMRRKDLLTDIGYNNNDPIPLGLLLPGGRLTHDWLTGSAPCCVHSATRGLRAGWLWYSSGWPACLVHPMQVTLLSNP